MKFLCVGCDAVMEFAERQLPGDGTMTAVFSCPKCQREVAMLANPMETQLVSGLGIMVGGRTVPEQPLEITQAAVVQPGPDGLGHTPTLRVVWDDAATQRLSNVPAFVRGMVKRIYTDYAREKGIAEITPMVMDQARRDLGLEDM